MRVREWAVHCIISAAATHGWVPGWNQRMRALACRFFPRVYNRNRSPLAWRPAARDQQHASSSQLPHQTMGRQIRFFPAPSPLLSLPRDVLAQVVAGVDRDKRPMLRLVYAQPEGQVRRVGLFVGTSTLVATSLHITADHAAATADQGRHPELQGH